MPQFDIFSFFSQLFWVFLGFLVFYLLICFYLLPAIASILKIRKRKLNQVSSNSNLFSDETSNNFLTSVKISLDDINNKLSSLTNVAILNNNLVKKLGSISVEFSTLREFNLSIFTQAQITSFLYS